MGEWATSDRNPLREMACWGSPHALTLINNKTQTKMSKQSIEVTGKSILRVGEAGTGFPYGSGTKLNGETYSRFTYEGEVFIVNDKADFAKDRKAGKIHTLFLLKTTESITNADGSTSTKAQYSYDGYASNAQMIGLTNTEAILQSIMKGSFKAEAELTEADLQALEQ